jgi:hypothetical protein
MLLRYSHITYTNSNHTVIYLETGKNQTVEEYITCDMILIQQLNNIITP